MLTRDLIETIERFEFVNVTKLVEYLLGKKDVEFEGERFVRPSAEEMLEELKDAMSEDDLMEWAMEFVLFDAEEALKDICINKSDPFDAVMNGIDCDLQQWKEYIQTQWDEKFAEDLKVAAYFMIPPHLEVAMMKKKFAVIKASPLLSREVWCVKDSAEAQRLIDGFIADSLKHKSARLSKAALEAVAEVGSE